MALDHSAAVPLYPARVFPQALVLLQSGKNKNKNKNREMQSSQEIQNVARLTCLSNSPTIVLKIPPYAVCALHLNSILDTTIFPSQLTTRGLRRKKKNQAMLDPKGVHEPELFTRTKPGFGFGAKFLSRRRWLPGSLLMTYLPAILLPRLRIFMHDSGACVGLHWRKRTTGRIDLLDKTGTKPIPSKRNLGSWLG